MIADAPKMLDGTTTIGGPHSEPGRRPSRFPGTYPQTEVMA